MSTLVKTTQFPSVKTLMEDFWNSDKFFSNDFFKSELPAVNVIDKGKTFFIEVSAPGFRKEDFKVEIEQGILTISAENQKSEHDEEDNYTRREFLRSSFTRTFSLPENVQQDEVNAKYENGMLGITLKKLTQKSAAKKKVIVS